MEPREVTSNSFHMTCKKKGCNLMKKYIIYILLQKWCEILDYEILLEIYL
jgi:hypothetical protein